MLELDPIRLALIGVAAVVAIGVIAVVLRVVVFRRDRGRSRQKAQFSGGGRIAVLESKRIDDERQLVLVRCDDVEHLIVVGGPADLVVEHDVKKARPHVPAARTAPAHAPQPSVALQPSAPYQAGPPAQPAAGPARVPPAMGASLDAAIAAAIPRSSEPARPAARPAPEPRPTLQPRPPLAAVSPRPAGRNGDAPTPRVDEPPRAAPQRAPADDLVRRELPQRRATPQPQLQAPRQSEAPRPQASGDNFVRSNHSNLRGGGSGLPPVQVPWVEPNSIEDEIVQALRFEPRRAEAPAARREPPAPRPVDSSTTLGDIAERLEEALAREIQTVEPSPRRAAGPEHTEVRRDHAVSEGGDSERGTWPVARDRQERRARPEPPRQSASPSPEPAREAPAPQPERREEAPVISLNARRREAADPLEDEMARLLGELTGDNKAR